jgi:L-aminopeptidase/D-esterase-like protein
MKGQITDVEGIRVGHCSDFAAVTGCTVILCEAGAVGGAEIRGSASGTRELDALHPLHLVDRIHGLVFAGGSAFGLEAAAGAMQYLEEKGMGFDVGITTVPIVPAAILFDLRIGDHRVRPDRAMGYRACESATAGTIEEGTVGAGTGATVGKLMGIECATKGGLGTSSLSLPGGVVVGALAVVNAFGDIIDPETDRILAGLRDGPNGATFLDTVAQMRHGIRPRGYGRESTTLVAVATNARLTKAQATKVAQQAHLGLVRTIRPVHTTLDGDVSFVLATGDVSADLDLLGVAAGEIVARAVVRAVRLARGIAGVPSLHDLETIGPSRQ